MRWPLFSRRPQGGGDPFPDEGDVRRADAGPLPRQPGPGGVRSPWAPVGAAGAAGAVGAVGAAGVVGATHDWETTRTAPSTPGTPEAGAFARTVVDALGDGRRPPASVGVVIDPTVIDRDTAAGADLLAGLTRLLPGLRLLPVAAGAEPPNVRLLDAIVERMTGVQALVAIGSSRTVDAARVLAAGGRDLTTLYAGRGGSQCLLPLTAPVPLVAVRTAALSADAPRAVVVGTDVGRLVLSGEPLEPRSRVCLPGATARDPLEAAPLVLVGRFLGPWHGAGLPAPQRVIHDVRAALAVVLDLALDPPAAIASGAVDRWEDLLRRGARVTGPPGHPCAYWLWPLAHEWATIQDLPVDRALGDLLPAWLDELRAAGLPDDQLALWHEAATSSRSAGSATTLTEADLRIALQRVDRWWRPIGPGIPDAGHLHRIFGPGRRSTA